MRFFLIENSETNWVDVVSLIQTNLNNSQNVVTELCSNELIYEFKVKNIIFSLVKNLKNSFTQFKIMNLIKKTRIRNRQKTANAIFYVNIKIKIIHDRKHKSLFLNSEDRTFLRLHKEYNLLDIINKKLSQQRCDSFTMKRRINRLTYELDLSLRWKIHSVIFVTQLEFASQDSYKRLKLDHLDFVFVKEDIETYKSYEIERILNKRTRQYKKIKMNQYLIRWKKYESKFDEWKSLSELKNCIDLIKDFERKKKTDSHKKTKSHKKTRSQKKTRSRKNRVNSSHQQ